jgi:hypothetical protein
MMNRNLILPRNELIMPSSKLISIPDPHGLYRRHRPKRHCGIQQMMMLPSAGPTLGATLPTATGPAFGYQIELLTHVFDGSASYAAITFSSGNWSLDDFAGGATVHTAWPGAGPYTWLTGGGSMIDYDIMFNVTGGALNGGGSSPGNTWVNAGALSSFYIEQVGFTSTQCYGSLHIRPAGGGADLASCTIFLYTYYDV